jgi:hypothetical protein
MKQQQRPAASRPGVQLLTKTCCNATLSSTGAGEHWQRQQQQPHQSQNQQWHPLLQQTLKQQHRRQQNHSLQSCRQHSSRLQRLIKGLASACKRSSLRPPVLLTWVAVPAVKPVRQQLESCSARQVRQLKKLLEAHPAMGWMTLMMPQLKLQRHMLLQQQRAI